MYRIGSGSFPIDNIIIEDVFSSITQYNTRKYTFELVCPVLNLIYLYIVGQR